MPPTLANLSLEDLLPHRGRMVLIREVLEVDADHAVTRCIVEKTWPLVQGGAVHPLVMVELAAQTAGVCNGWDRVHTRGLDSDRMGWLVGVKKAEFFVDGLKLGSTVVVRARNTHIFGNLREVSCEMHRSDTLIGQATLQLFQAE